MSDSEASDAAGDSSGEEYEEEGQEGTSSIGAEMDEAEEEEEGAVGGGAGGSDEEGDGAEPTQQQLEERRRQNIRALVSGTALSLRRQPLLPRLLTVQQAAVVLKRPFKSPHPSAPAMSEALKRKLAARKSFVPWGGSKFVPLRLKAPPREPLELPLPQEAPAAAAAEPAVVLPAGVEPLVLWEPPAGEEGQAVRVDDMLTQYLRPHQREGVQFMFECVCGLRKFEGHGCILADDMGLGKTLQGISLLWTLLSAPGHALLGGAPIAKRVVICCPTSLVGNWDSECQKWLKGRVRTLALCESSREEAVASISQFLSPRNPYQVMIVSYETFRIHAERFRAEGSCDLLICDEAHRLKNDATLTNRALDSLACRRRVLLSGTPLQNRLDEFYAMVSFCNPGVLGSPAQFRRHFEAPILAGREPGASEAEGQLCQERTAELSSLVNEFILRRTNTLLSQHLPPKVVEIVCCRLTPVQLALYCHFLESKAARSLFATQKAARVLSAITSLRKLLNHPKLIWDALNSSARHDDGGGGGASKDAEGFEGCADFFPPGMFGGGRTGRGGMPPGWELLSGKFAVLAGMLELLRTCTTDRIVIVSNYTQTLDLVAQLCRDRGYPFVRLDGTTTIKKRNKLVKDFNDPFQSQFAFLLSSKAGGCGLNLIGGNRLVLFDPSWNPADDKQAMGRVWRDGQKKQVYVYRFMATGTIEEKVYQRQLSKEGLQQVVDTAKGGGRGGAGAGPNLMSMEELRDLFSYDPDTLSSTYDSMCCQRQVAPPAGGDGSADAAKAGKRGKKGGRGGSDSGAAVGGGRRGRAGGAGREAAARKRRRRSWSSSNSGSDGGAGMGSSEEEEDLVGVAGSDADSEVVILDSEDEQEAAAGAAGAATRMAAAQQRQGHAAVQRGSAAGSDASREESADGWSSEEEPLPTQEVQQQQEPPPPQSPGAEQQQQQQQQQQAGAQPAAAEQQEAVSEAPPAAAAADGGQQQAHAQQQLPTAAIKRMGGTIHKEQVGKPGEEQLRLWGHHSSTATAPDQVLRAIGDEWVSFVFSLQVDGRPVDPEPPLAPLAQQPAAQGACRQPRRQPAAAWTAAAAAPRQPGLAAAAAGALAGAAPPQAPQQQPAAPAPHAQQPRPQQPQQSALPAAGTKENAGGDNTGPAAAPVPVSKLVLPRLQQRSGAGPHGIGTKRPGGGLSAAVRRAVQSGLSDSDDDFK